MKNNALQIIDHFKVRKDGYTGFPNQLLSYGYFSDDKNQHMLAGDIVKDDWTSSGVIFELKQWYKEKF